MSPRDDLTRLGDIRDAIVAITRYAADLGSPNDHVTQMAMDAVKYNLLVIGEAAGAMSEVTKARATEVPWSQMKGLRNVLAHAYFAVDVGVIREIVEGSDLAALDRAVRMLLAESD